MKDLNSLNSLTESQVMPLEKSLSRKINKVKNISEKLEVNRILNKHQLNKETKSALMLVQSIQI